MARSVAGLREIFNDFGYDPTPAQWAVHQNDSRFRVVAAGARFGKSMLAGAEIAASIAVIADYHVWVCSSLYELAEKEFDWTFKFLSRLKTSRGCILDCARVSMPERGERSIVFPWGSWVKTKSAEKLQSLLGEELDFLVLGEASQLCREAWDRFLRERLGSRQGRMLSTSTPNSDSGLFLEHWQKGQENQNKEWKSWRFSVLENVHFSRDEYNTLKNDLENKNFLEQCEGEFISRRGLVLASFDKKRHVCQDLPEGSEQWPVFRTIQRGFKNPYVVLFVVIDPLTKDYWVFDEIYKTEATTADIIPMLKEKSKGHRVGGNFTNFKDTAGQDELKKAGFPCVVNDESKFNKNMAIMKRLECLQNVFKVQDDGSVRIHIHERCGGLIGEIEKFKWPDSPPETKDKAESELPLTKYFQAPMALSYFTAYIERTRGIKVYG